MATCDDDLTNSSATGGSNTDTIQNPEQPATITPIFAEYQKMPDWKKELIQKRKNVSKTMTSPSMNSFDEGKFYNLNSI